MKQVTENAQNIFNALLSSMPDKFIFAFKTLYF